jgi:hypothetical protein
MCPMMIMGFIDIVFILAFNPGKERFTSRDKECRYLLIHTGIFKIVNIFHGMGIRKMDDNFKLGWKCVHWF